jgi:hypothetical protein
LVDKVYELEPKLPSTADKDKKLDIAPELLAFENERFRASVSFVASLYLSAWEKSAKVTVPQWVKPTDGPAAPK